MEFSDHQSQAHNGHIPKIDKQLKAGDKVK